MSALFARAIASPLPEHDEPDALAIAPGKRTATQELRAPSPGARRDAALQLARAALDEARDVHLPGLRAAIDARAMKQARAAADALRAALATVEAELGAAGDAAPEAAELRAELDGLRAEAEPVLASAPPPAPNLPFVGPWLLAYSPVADSYQQADRSNETAWTDGLDSKQAAPDEEVSSVGIVVGLTDRRRGEHFSSKDEVVNAIVDKADIFFQHKRDVLQDMEAAMEELPARNDSFADMLLDAALDASLRGALAGLAMKFVEQLGPKVGQSTADAIKTGLREVAQGGLRAASDPGAGTERGDGGSEFVFTNPRSAFFSRYRKELTFRQADARGVVASQRDELAELDMSTLVEVNNLLGSENVAEGIRENFSERLIVDWMNFAARWTSYTENAQRDARPDHIDNDLKGFVLVDIDMRRSLEPDTVKAEFRLEPRLIDSIKQSETLRETTLGAFPVHRIYWVSVGAYNSSWISMGPSGIADVSNVTDEDLDGVRIHLQNASILATKDDARKRLLEIVFEVNESLTLEELL